LEQEEIWKDICGHDGYQVSTLGNVRSLDREIITKQGNIRKYKGRVLSLMPDMSNKGNGYLVVNLGRKALTIRVHKLVALTFLLNEYNLPIINHKNGVKIDNKVSNLEWCSYSHNNKHACITGLHIPPKGEEAYNHKLTNKKVICIKELLSNKSLSQRDIAWMYNVSQRLINKINKGLAWQHI
jgi:predicted XRE-type DNA-binding protein